MNGDFSRDTFDPLMRFSRVLLQQGRVHVDADWNEQVSILLHHLRALAADVIGSFGGLGFEISAITLDAGGHVEDFAIGEGQYYVDGFLCESPLGSMYAKQDGNPPDGVPDLPVLVYLDVWERHLTFLEQPSIREVALDGPDTSSRARVICQVRTTDEAPEGLGITDPADVKDNWDEWKTLWQPENRGLMAACAQTGQQSTDICIEPPESRYRGPENQLYRVEIHEEGPAASSEDAAEAAGATFKWSRENASVAFAIETLTINDADVLTTVILEHLGKDVRFGLQVGDWVEILDEDAVLRGDHGSLLQIREIDRPARLVVLDGVSTVTPDPETDPDKWKNPILRRWDHRDEGAPLHEGAVSVREGSWLNLEDGVQILFEEGVDEGATYRTGDFWLIPARVATGDVEWPLEGGQPRPLPPKGVEHHYAPLALIAADGTVANIHGRRGQRLDVLVHLEETGDQSYRENELAGTRGQSRRLEGFQIRFDPPVANLSMRYMAHLQDIGDVSFVNEGQFIGTRGESRRLEGFAIELTGSAAPNFNVFYMAHLQDIGDTNFFQNGQFCGTRGESRRMEAILVRVEPR